MKFCHIVFILLGCLGPLQSRAQTLSKKEGAITTPTKKTIVKYKEHTQLDFSGQKVEGRIRSPEVFYIFQRKRNLGPQIVELPESLEYERSETQKIMEEEL
jgi:hypothetical protein